MRLVLLGAPGSGKGTQGAALAKHFGVPHVSSGDLLRWQIAHATELGQQVAHFVASGELVPDDLVLAVVGDALDTGSNTKGYILDGFPRTLSQAERAHELAPPAGITADLVVYLAMADDVARCRVAGRTALGRTDDADPAVIDRRLQVYHGQTEPLLDFYRECGLLETVEADQSVDAVTDAIFAAVALRA